MKIFKLELGYKLTPKDIDAETGTPFTPITLTIALIRGAVMSTYLGERGEVNMKRKDGRTWGKIEDKFDEAMENKAVEVEFSDEQFDFIKKLIVGETAKIHPGAQKWFNLLEDYVTELVLTKEKE